MEPNSGRLDRRTSIPTTGTTKAAQSAGDEPISGDGVDTNPQTSGDVPHEQHDYTPGSENPQPMSMSYTAKKQVEGPRSQNPGALSTRAESSKKEKPKQPPVTPLLELPVTKISLSELDANKIVHNPKLRHDINFNPDLHFRPNTDGEKGRRKLQKANEFWNTLGTQLAQFMMNREEFESVHGAMGWTLPTALTAIRDILETLVPERDRASVEETFNVELLMQQIGKRVADLTRLAQWLSGLLKRHCAPMRDGWVDLMVTQISEGDRNMDIGLLIEGIKSLLSILEAMKLDVANHQIRCLREILIEDTVQFEHKFFAKKILSGKLDIQGAHQWFKQSVDLLDMESPVDVSMQSKAQLWGFFKALVNFTLPSKASEPVPHTFLFDEDRIVKLRTDMLDAINLEICMALYRQLKAESIRFTRSGLIDSHEMQNERVYGLSASMDPSSRPTTPDRYVRSVPSSPDSSVSLASSRNSVRITSNCFSISSHEPSNELRTSLLDILASAVPNTDKWATLSPALALQILRSTSAPLTELPAFESRVASHISNIASSVYKEAERVVTSQLYPHLKMLVETYMPLSNLQVSDAATSPRKPNTIVHHATTMDVPTEKEPIIDMATRLAHIGILHWRVWGPLVYIDGPEMNDTDMGEDEIRGVPSNRQSTPPHEEFSGNSGSAYI